MVFSFMHTGQAASQAIAAAAQELLAHSPTNQPTATAAIQNADSTGSGPSPLPRFPGNSTIRTLLHGPNREVNQLTFKIRKQMVGRMQQENPDLSNDQAKSFAERLVPNKKASQKIQDGIELARMVELNRLKQEVEGGLDEDRQFIFSHSLNHIELVIPDLLSKVSKVF